MFMVELDENQLVPGTRDVVVGPYKTLDEAERAADFVTRHTGLPAVVKPVIPTPTEPAP